MTTFRKHIETTAPNGTWRSKVYNFLQERGLWVPAWPAANNRLDKAPPDASDVVADNDSIGAIPSGPGAVMRYGFTAPGTAILANDLACLDDSVDWRDRMLRIDYQFTADSTRMPGGANDFQFDGGNVPNASVQGRLLYTGLGITDAGGNNPTAGNPPVNASAGGHFARYMDNGLTDLVLYVENKSPFRLCVYNKSGTSLYLAFRVWGSIDLGKR